MTLNICVELKNSKKEYLLYCSFIYYSLTLKWLHTDKKVSDYVEPVVRMGRVTKRKEETFGGHKNVCLFCLW